MGSITAIINWAGTSIVSSVIEQISEQPSHRSFHSYSCHIAGNLAFSELALNCTPEPLPEKRPIISDCGRFIIVTDARIDNRLALLESLSAALRAFSQPTDADIILAAFRKWGQQCPVHLLGDFAFVIWDNHQKTVFASRDAMNMRTLSYQQAGDTLFIATEGAQLLQLSPIPARINKQALASWISGWPDPNISMFDGIKLLPAGHSLLANANGVKIERYWSLDTEFKIRHSSISAYESQLRDILTHAVRDRMRSTLPIIATQMSGGMDSTTVTALANQLAEKTHKQVAVISHTYKATASCDESTRIDEMRRHLGINNIHYMAAEQHAALDFRELYPPSLENPGTVCSPRYIDEMKLLNQVGANVLLTGSGGDEMTWGHSLTYSRRLWRGDIRAVQEAVRGCREMQLPLLNTLLHLFVTPVIPQRIKQGIRQLRGKSATSSIPPWIPGAAQQLLEQNEKDNSDATHFSNPALQARYKAWMNSSTINSVRSYHQAASAFGIEVRHPFFDRRLVEFSFAIPDDLWIRENYPKWLLRRSMAGLLPNPVCWNKNKVIFDDFFGRIIRDQQETIRHILSDRRLHEMGLVDNRKLLSAFDAVVTNPKISLNVDLLYALMAQIWFQKHAQVFGH